MTTAIYYICDKCGDEIKDDIFADIGEDDRHFHLDCLEIKVGVAA